jgi:DUF4097 and DUF4098 domain-containing protein YvlB
MIPMLAAVLLTTSVFTVHTDTTVTVKPDTRLVVENFGGGVTVSTWTRNAVRIEAEHSTRAMVEIEMSDNILKVSSSGRRGPPSATDYTISMPKGMELRVNGVYTDVTVEGSEAEVRAQTVRGDISLRGGRGFVSLRSVQGEVKVRGARGRIEVASVNEAVEVADVVGEIQAETVNGDVTLENVTSSMIDASTVNGDICYSGAIAKDGHYRFATHNGDIGLGLPDDASATVSVSTFQGDFESVFKTRLTDSGGKRFNFTLGSGSAEIALESFQGTIRLGRAGERCGADREGMHQHVKARLKEKEKEKQKDPDDE